MEPYCNFTNRDIPRCQAIRKSKPVGQCAKAAERGSTFCNQHSPDNRPPPRRMTFGLHHQLAFGGQRTMSNATAAAFVSWIDDVMAHLKREYDNAGGEHVVRLVRRMEPTWKPKEHL